MPNQNSIPKASRPGEYIAIAVFVLPTMEGPGYVFIACDAYSEFAINLGVEPNDSKESVLKMVRVLLENKDFRKHRDKGFTFVLDHNEEMGMEIEKIIQPFKGKVLYHPEFQAKIVEPVITMMSKSFSGKNRN